MQLHKTLILIIFLILLSAFAYQNKTKAEQWVIYKECFLSVNGSTNVNKFDCVISSYYRPDTLTFYKNNDAEMLKMTGVMKLDISSFDCHNPMMTADLRKTLKYKEFPKLIIRFLSISRYPDASHKTIKGWVAIELAGVSKKFEVNYNYQPGTNNTLTLTGTREVNFSDFNIIPPRKIGGMIQTNNELDIKFNLKMKILD